MFVQSESKENFHLTLFVHFSPLDCRLYLFTHNSHVNNIQPRLYGACRRCVYSPATFYLFSFLALFLPIKWTQLMVSQCIPVSWSFLSRTLIFERAIIGLQLPGFVFEGLFCTLGWLMRSVQTEHKATFHLMLITCVWTSDHLCSLCWLALNWECRQSETSCFLCAKEQLA